MARRRGLVTRESAERLHAALGSLLSEMSEMAGEEVSGR